MSDVSTSSTTPTNAATRVAPTPVSTGQTGQQHAPPHGGGQQAGAEHTALPHDTAVTLSPSLAGYAEGDIIAAQTLTQNATGHQILQTPHAVFVTVEATALPDRAAVNLRVASVAGDHIRAVLVSIDNEELPAPRNLSLRLVQVSFPDTAPPPSAPTGKTGPLPLPETAALPVLQAETPVRALLIATPANDAANRTPLPSSPPNPPANLLVSDWTPGTFRSVQIAAVSMRPDAPATTTAAREPQSTNAATRVATGVSTQAPSTTASTSPGSPAPQVSYAAPAASTPPPTQTQPLRIAGTVLPSPRANQTLIATASGTIVLPGRPAQEWPPGSVVILEAADEASPQRTSDSGLLPAATAATAASRPETTEQFMLRVGETWPAMRDLVTHVAANAPAVAQGFAQTRLPSPNARAASQILFFLSVLRTGDVAGWLGNDVVRVLERTGQRGLVDRLADDFRQLRRLGNESGATDWRLLLFPFSDSDRVDPVRMFVRGQRRDRNDSDHDLRFIVDVRLSALGDLQFDGLLHGRTFDLIVRSHDALNDQRRGDISEIFMSGLETLGFRGALSFQTVREFPVQPFNDLLGTKHTPGAVLA